MNIKIECEILGVTKDALLIKPLRDKDPSWAKVDNTEAKWVPIKAMREGSGIPHFKSATRRAILKMSETRAKNLWGIERTPLAQTLAEHELWLVDSSRGEQADFSGQNLAGVDFSHRALQKAKFVKANLKGANLEDAELEEADFTDANLDEANLKSATLTKAVLEKTTLVESDLEHADVNGTSLEVKEVGEIGRVIK